MVAFRLSSLACLVFAAATLPCVFGAPTGGHELTASQPEDSLQVPEPG